MTRLRHQFTLLELMLVLTVVATLGLVVAPRMSASLGLSRLRTQARSTVAIAKLARSRSASEGRIYLLSLDPTERTLRLLRHRDPLVAPTDDEYPERELPSDDERWSRPIVFEEGVELLEAEVNGEIWDAATSLELSFRPSGESDAAVLLLVAGEDQLRVVIDGPLALARVEETDS